MEFLERLKKEYEELDQKIYKLKIFMTKDEFNNLDKTNQYLLKEQYNCMVNYSAILKIRIRYIERFSKMDGKLTEKIFNINKSQKEITIKFGDIFSENGIKIIPCNDSFDTQVDEIIVSSKTLHGMFINNIIRDKFEDFKNDLDRHLKAKQDNFDYYNQIRNAVCYKIGTCIEIIPNEYVIVAFSKFDDNHKAYLSSEDYDQCMDKMWTELCKLNIENKTVNLPIMGSGVTQLLGYDFNQNQEDLTSYYTVLINKMIKPLKDKKLPDSTKIAIVIYEGIKDKIDLEKLNIDKL